MTDADRMAAVLLQLLKTFAETYKIMGRPTKRALHALIEHEPAFKSLIDQLDHDIGEEG